LLLRQIADVEAAREVLAGPKAAKGNPRLRSTMIELAWLWQRHQPTSTLSRWFHTRVGSERGRIRRISIVALARKLLIAVWRYVTQGEVPEGAVLKA
jgi:transposase